MSFVGNVFGRYYDSDFRHKNARREVVSSSSLFYNFVFFMKLIKYMCVWRKCIAPSERETNSEAGKIERRERAELIFYVLFLVCI